VSGFWLVEVERDGKPFFASTSMSNETARLDSKEDAESFAEEVLAYYQRVHNAAQKLKMLTHDISISIVYKETFGGVEK